LRRRAVTAGQGSSRLGGSGATLEPSNRRGKKRKTTTKPEKTVTGPRWGLSSKKTTLADASSQSKGGGVGAEADSANSKNKRANRSGSPTPDTCVTRKNSGSSEELWGIIGGVYRCRIAVPPDEKARGRRFRGGAVVSFPGAGANENYGQRVGGLSRFRPRRGMRVRDVEVGGANGSSHSCFVPRFLRIGVALRKKYTLKLGRRGKTVPGSLWTFRDQSPRGHGG